METVLKLILIILFILLLIWCYKNLNFYIERNIDNFTDFANLPDYVSISKPFYYNYSKYINFL